MLRLGLVNGTSGNVSAREGALVRITPSALPYPGMTVNDLVTITMDGAILAGEHEPSSEWRVHVAVYAAAPTPACWCTRTASTRRRGASRASRSRWRPAPPC